MLPPTEAQARGAALLAPIALLSLGPYLALWGPPNPPFPTRAAGILLFLSAFTVGVVLHEALHGLGHVWGGASWADVRFGMHWTALTPFAQCTVPTRARSYRRTLALPGLVLGAGPLTIGLAVGIWLPAFYGFLMLVAAAGDFLILWILVGVPADAWVQDHPQRVGCLVVDDTGSDRPPPVSQEDLPDDATINDSPSFVRLLLLAILSAVAAAIGFVIAIG
ncbi:DUF3267 domain-containing protein [Salinibacter grassmerensis]|uniref:DUF3267 domain-containing protein n=1 Tax=Salinibacter grassmerensis TaxID=3040353 RepID=UPI0021E70B85|nr:DUF3267 domain-containing protein [Salinibacter grassmerensis]